MVTLASSGALSRRDLSAAVTLTESLALRLTATVVEARWQAGEVDGASVGEVVSVAATLRPSLGLYLAF